MVYGMQITRLSTFNYFNYTILQLNDILMIHGQYIFILVHNPSRIVHINSRIMDSTGWNYCELMITHQGKG